MINDTSLQLCVPVEVYYKWDILWSQFRYTVYTGNIVLVWQEMICCIITKYRCHQIKDLGGKVAWFNKVKILVKLPDYVVVGLYDRRTPWLLHVLVFPMQVWQVLHLKQLYSAWFLPGMNGVTLWRYAWGSVQLKIRGCWLLRFTRKLQEALKGKWCIQGYGDSQKLLKYVPRLFHNTERPAFNSVNKVFL